MTITRMQLSVELNQYLQQSIQDDVQYFFSSGGASLKLKFSNSHLLAKFYRQLVTAGQCERVSDVIAKSELGLSNDLPRLKQLKQLMRDHPQEFTLEAKHKLEWNSYQERYPRLASWYIADELDRKIEIGDDLPSDGQILDWFYGPAAMEVLSDPSYQGENKPYYFFNQLWNTVLDHCNNNPNRRSSIRKIENAIILFTPISLLKGIISFHCKYLTLPANVQQHSPDPLANSMDIYNQILSKQYLFDAFDDDTSVKKFLANKYNSSAYKRLGKTARKQRRTVQLYKLIIDARKMLGEIFAVENSLDLCIDSILTSAQIDCADQAKLIELIHEVYPNTKDSLFIGNRSKQTLMIKQLEYLLTTLNSYKCYRKLQADAYPQAHGELQAITTSILHEAKQGKLSHRSLATITDYEKVKHDLANNFNFINNNKNFFAKYFDVENPDDYSVTQLLTVAERFPKYNHKYKLAKILQTAISKVADTHSLIANLEQHVDSYKGYWYHMLNPINWFPGSLTQQQKARQVAFVIKELCEQVITAKTNRKVKARTHPKRIVNHYQEQIKKLKQDMQVLKQKLPSCQHDMTRRKVDDVIRRIDKAVKSQARPKRNFFHFFVAAEPPTPSKDDVKQIIAYRLEAQVANKSPIRIFVA